ncbi:hypothetical protein COW81_01185 [Candidatus Campbellbacteria bacterium CG22_combo_CG10-13_8_21_14_all_36_13]|uniref:Peptidase M16 n=1 Tax=Candidatus Campbellbacteria bacterium CG22_combo_CG10-13_8_21_14_all_36_13 TaxID=1974529 RepID=A0A2H0DYK0_9BACT|nr:MAG: hypothetical protein COW81_01185 [Candidatus Campbellbacteria bacterium CG22_combo_CG10-13_8_21_14_all_36_13]
MKKPVRKVLDNGMRIVVVPMPGSPTVTTVAFVEAGSKYETKEINGISHFLEHMFFKGTEKRKKSIDISGELDGIGALSNAFTGNEYTGYYAKARAKYFTRIADVISDMFLNSKFPKEEIEKERGVIMAEIDMYEDLPQFNVEEVLDNLMYGDQPAGWSIAGPKENIKKISQEDFFEYRKKHYVAEKTAIVVAGDVNPKDVFKEIEKKFENVSTSKGLKKLKVKESQTTKQVLLKHKTTDQTHVAIGFRSFKVGHKDNVKIKVLADVLGGSMSARLFQRLREEMGVAYYVRSSNNSQSDVGVFSIKTGVDSKRIDEVLNALGEEILKLKNELVEEKELKKSKEHMIGMLGMALEASDDVAMWVGSKEILHQELITPDILIKEIQKVTAKDIQKMAQTIFQEKGMNLAIIGPHKDGKELLKHLKV